MKLSIIIPAYNAAETLEKCLDSVLGQTEREFEVLVINDGSTDRTEEILKAYADRERERFRFLTVTNGGQGRARNFGLDMAGGEYIGFADSDDWVDPDMYGKLIACAEREGSDLVLCDVVSHYPDGSTETEVLWREGRPMAAAGFQNNKLFRRELLNGLRFPEGLWYEDAELTAKAIHRAKHFCRLPEALYHYRRGFPSTMNNANALKNLDVLTVMEHLKEELLPDAREDYEFLLLNHVLLDAMNRVQAMKVPQRKEVLGKLREYVRHEIPDLSACRSFREETRNRRIIMRLHYMGRSDEAAAVLNLKAKMRG